MSFPLTSFNHSIVSFDSAVEFHQWASGRVCAYLMEHMPSSADWMYRHMFGTPPWTPNTQTPPTNSYPTPQQALSTTSQLTMPTTSTAAPFAINSTFPVSVPAAQQQLYTSTPTSPAHIHMIPATASPAPFPAYQPPLPAAAPATLFGTTSQNYPDFLTGSFLAMDSTHRQHINTQHNPATQTISYHH